MDALLRRFARRGAGQASPPRRAAPVLALVLVLTALAAMAFAADLTADITAPSSIAAREIGKFNVLIDLPGTSNEPNIDLATVELSATDYPEVGWSSATDGSVTAEGLYQAKFKRSFLADVLEAAGAQSIDDLSLTVRGELTDDTTFEGQTTADVWKPLTITDLVIADSMGNPETEFSPGEPLWVQCDFYIDSRTPGDRQKVQLFIKAFDQTYASPKLSCGEGDGYISYILLVPGGTPPGPEDLDITLRMWRNGDIYDKVKEVVPITILSE